MKKMDITARIGKQIATLCAIIVWTVIPAGCDKTPEPVNNEYGEINDWILENMSGYYFWNERIPQRTDKTLPPAEYFESLLYAAEDRFSWIQENFMELMQYLSGVTPDAGYEFNLFVTEASNTNNTPVYGYIAYIKPGTPAENAALKRGDFFTSINGTAMTIGNYEELLSQISQPHTIGIVGRDTPVQLAVINGYAENPLLMDTTYLIADRKIGYFVYNFFARDSEEFGVAYEEQLNALFAKYAAEGINELIIDLRYNQGGAVMTAEALASMASGLGQQDVFGYELYNTLLDEYWRGEDANYNITMFPDDIERYDSNGRLAAATPINKLSGLNRLHLVVTRNSASASELLINSLRPYMEVVLIGEPTYGKNVGSFTIYETDAEKQKTNTWGMQPIVLKFENALHFSDYAAGFAPDIEADELEDEMRPLGDTGELMLAAALNHILGGSGTLQRAATRQPTHAKRIGSSLNRHPARQNMYLPALRTRQ